MSNTYPDYQTPGYYPTITATSGAAAPIRRSHLVVEAGTATLTPGIATSKAQVTTTYGAKAASAFERYRRADPSGEVWIVPVEMVAGEDEEDPETPAVAAALERLVNTPGWVFFSDFSDEASINAIHAFIDARWSDQQQLYGHAVIAVKGTTAELLTYADTKNTRHVTVVGVDGSEDDPLMIAAAVAPVVALQRNDPVRPLQKVVLDFAAPPLAKQFSFAEIESLLRAGVSPVTVNDAGQPVLVQAVTLRTTDDEDQPDTSWRLTTTALSAHVVADRFHGVYDRYGLAHAVLVDEGTPISAGSNRKTAQGVLGLFIAEYSAMCREGLCRNEADFIKNATVTELSGGRLFLHLPVTLATGLTIVFTRIVVANV